MTIDLSKYGERFADRKPRILVGLVAFGDIDPEVVLSWIGWTGYTAKHYGDQLEVQFIGGLRKEQYRARNYIAEAACDNDFDFCLFVDDDQMVADCPDMLKHFLEEGKPMQCALAFQRNMEGFQNPTVYHAVFDDEGRRTFKQYTREELPSEPCAVDYSGGGCTWVDVTLLKKMLVNWWWPIPARVMYGGPNPEVGLDLFFCQRVKTQGEEVWLNTKVKTGHMQHERKVVR